MADRGDGPPHEHEEALRSEWLDRPDRHLAEVASSVLAVAIDRATGELRNTNHDARRLGVIVAAIRAFRAIRAAIAAVSFGYELEAEAWNRCVLELFVAARAILADDSGDEANAWLAGDRARGIGRRVEAALPAEGTYGILSRSVHGDPRALTRLAVAEGAEPVIEWGPARTDLTAAVLMQFTVAARDFAVLLEEAGFQALSELTALDARMKAQIPGWAPDEEWRYE